MDTGSAINQYFWFETIVLSANANRPHGPATISVTTISVTTNSISVTTNSAHRADALTSVGKSP
jgi:hypothetical protein